MIALIYNYLLLRRYNKGHSLDFIEETLVEKLISENFDQIALKILILGDPFTKIWL